MMGLNTLALECYYDGVFGMFLAIEKKKMRVWAVNVIIPKTDKVGMYVIGF